MSTEIEKLILAEVRILQDEVKQIGKEVARLQVKAGITGLLGGLLPAIGILIFWLAK